MPNNQQSGPTPSSSPRPGPARKPPPPTNPRRRPILSPAEDVITGPYPAISVPPDIPAGTRPGPTSRATAYAGGWRDRMGAGARPPGVVNWSTIVAAAALAGALVIGIWFVAQLRSTSDDSPVFGASGGPFVNPTVDDLARATVQILGIGADGQSVCTGSGTLVSADGLILTNAHVVTSDTVCDFSSLVVAVADDANRAPDRRYEAEVVQVDAGSDLAVIRISRSVDPAGTLPPSFPYLVLGDSDDLMVGDDLRILGYPEIAGEKVTFTNGSVGGFTPQDGLGDRALIRTDATIAGGNSGGAAVDRNGRLVGIPTKARAGEDGSPADCRPLSEGDAEPAFCIPVDGTLNGIRPVNFAQAIVTEATNTPVAGPEEAPRITVDPAAVVMTRPRFSVGESENQPTQVVRTASAGATELCLFVDWEGIPDGILWDGIWWRNGELIEDYSLVEQRWEFGETGSNFWMCAIDAQNGLAPGVYELGFFLDAQLVFAEGLVVTEEPAELLEVTWENGATVDLCSLAINPAASGQVGLNELQPGVVIPPGGTATIALPAGEAVVEARDCSGQALADSAGTLLIEPEVSYLISDPSAPPLPAANPDDDG